MPWAELVELVWPGLVVEENNLQVQISALLGAGPIATVPGRGYRFTLAVNAPASGPDTAAQAPADALPPPARPLSNLPLDRDPLIGRDAAMLAIGGLLRQHRLGHRGWGSAAWASRAWRARSGGAKSVALPTASGGSTWARCHAATASRRRSRRPAVCGLRFAVCGLPLGDDDGNGTVLLPRVLAGQRCLLVLDNCEHAPVGDVAGGAASAG